MKKIIPLLSIAFIILIAFPTFASDLGENKIALKLVPFNLKDDRFYIKEIIDGREDKTRLGEVKGWLSKVTPTTLAGDFRTSLQALYDLSFPKSNSKIPIIININILKIKETGELHTYFSTEAKLAFYKEKDGKIGKVFETESYAEKKDWSVNENEKNIRQVLEQCTKNFISSNWETTIPNWEEYENVIGQSTGKDHQMTITMPERHEVYLLEPISNEPYSGGSYIHYQYDNHQTGWINISSHSFTFYSFDYGSYNGDTYKITNTSGLMRRLGDSGLAVILEGGIPCGLEYQPGKQGFFYGLNTQESLVYFPNGKEGIAATLGCYQTQLFEIDQPSWDNGVRFSLGYQW